MTEEKKSSEWTDEELLGYIDQHSRSELALTSHEHVRRLFELAGLRAPANWQSGFVSCRQEVIAPILRVAWRNLRARRATDAWFPTRERLAELAAFLPEGNPRNELTALLRALTDARPRLERLAAIEEVVDRDGSTWLRHVRRDPGVDARHVSDDLIWLACQGIVAAGEELRAKEAALAQEAC